MSKKLFLLDAFALIYRAHFALIQRPIFTSKGVNTSALYGFTQTVLEILSKQQPTHIAVAFDTEAPTPRHIAYPEYKATRQAMPEDLSAALPHVRHMLEAFRIPLLECDGFEADDVIGTLARRAEKQGFQTYMVTPDKDFGGGDVTDAEVPCAGKPVGVLAQGTGFVEAPDRLQCGPADKPRAGLEGGDRGVVGRTAEPARHGSVEVVLLQA